MTSFFEKIGSRAEAGLRRVATPRQYPAGATIFYEGDRGDVMHVLVAGAVSVSVADVNGATVMVNILGPGDLLGEMSALVGDQFRSGTATAIDDTTTLTVNGPQLDGLRDVHRSIDRALVSILAIKLRDTSLRVLESARMDARQRVLRQLGSLVRLSRAEDDQVEIPITQEVLANMAGADRRKANEVLGELEKAGIVERGTRGRIVVRDPGALLERVPPVL
ncbi:MAG: Crp/Fnr family transcriptional regulator [Actinomycetota bacterium]